MHRASQIRNARFYFDLLLFPINNSSLDKSFAPQIFITYPPNMHVNFR